MSRAAALLAVVVATLAASEAAQALASVQPLVPVDPKHTLAEWEAILDALQPRPEACGDCVPGTEPQHELAGKLAAGVPAHAPRRRGSRIIGGSAAAAGQFPWQAQVRMDGSYFCGGSIISESWILSAGHCAQGYRQFKIVVGSLYSGAANDPGRLTFVSTEATAHQDFDLDLINNDISVIRLPARIKSWTSSVRPVRLPPRGLVGADLAGLAGVISGFGRYGTDSVSSSISPTLRYVDVDIISNYKCAQTFGGYILSSNICTSGGTGAAPTSSCNGDSGGPLITSVGDSYVEVGIVSFGSGRGCNLGYPSAFTRVTSYLDWISNNTGIAISE